MNLIVEKHIGLSNLMERLDFQNKSDTDITKSLAKLVAVNHSNGEAVECVNNLNVVVPKLKQNLSLGEAVSLLNLARDVKESKHLTELIVDQLPKDWGPRFSQYQKKGMDGLLKY